MPTDAMCLHPDPARHALIDVGSPWRRLYWTLPLALTICVLAFAFFSVSMEREAPRPAQPRPMDAQLVELPAAPANHPAPTQVTPPPPPKPSVQPDALPQPAKAQPTAKPAQETPAPPQAAAPVTPQSHAARSLSQPMPVIPDELRDEAMHERAIARFDIAADGSVRVKLIKPTQNPQLNRLLLETLREWKFDPAIQDGKPVPSTQDIAIRVQVD